MGHSVVRTESRQNHFHSSQISPKRGTTFSRQRQFTSNKINELIHVRQRIVLKMGLTLKLEATKPAAKNFLQQQARFDDFIDGYNNERPHQALNMQCPAQRYQPSCRPYRGLPDIDYSLHDKAATVTTCGRICFNNQKINLSQVFAGQTVGIKQTEDRIWLVSFMDYDLGYFDDETCRLEPLANPFGPKVLPMFSE